MNARTFIWPCTSKRRRTFLLSVKRMKKVSQRVDWLKRTRENTTRRAINDRRHSFHGNGL